MTSGRRKGPQVTKICDACARAFSDSPKAAARRKYCSVACYHNVIDAQAKASTVAVACRTCATEFTTNRVRPAIYCSGSCRGAAARLPRPDLACSECGAPLKIAFPSTRRRFCGIKCSAASQRTSRTSSYQPLLLTAKERTVVVAELRQKQCNMCAICGSTFVRSPHLDHDHATGQVRGLLCNRCNTGLGMFKDSTELLAKATHYLEGSLLCVSS